MKEEQTIAFIDKSCQDTAFCNIQSSVRAALKQHHGLQKQIAKKIGITDRQFRNILSGTCKNMEILERASELIYQEEVKVFKSQERTLMNLRRANNLNTHSMAFSVLLDRVEAVANGLAIREDYDPTATYDLQSTTLEGALREVEELQAQFKFSICILQNEFGDQVKDFGTLQHEIQ